MKLEDMKKLHLVTLSGGGDVYHKLVGPKTFEFISSEWSSPDGSNSYDEIIPEEVKEEIQCLSGETSDDSIHITIGSFDNDRAIQLDGKDFDSATQAVKWAVKSGVELGEEYDGCVY